MKVQVLNRTDSEIRFLVEGIKPAFAGALRRIMMTEVPTMAIEWVDFKKNGSALPDELLANRLGQIPLTYDERAYNLPADCKCKGKGCSRCQVKLSIKKAGPAMAYSGDMKSTDKGVQAVYDKIPIVELFEDQELQFVAIAQLGLGREHIKWQGAVVGYKNLPKITIRVKNTKDVEKYVRACPKRILKIEKNRLIVTNPYDCNLCMQCVDAARKAKDEIKAEAVEDSFIFNVETASGLKPERVVTLAAEVLEKKIKNFSKDLRKIK